MILSYGIHFIHKVYYIAGTLISNKHSDIKKSLLTCFGKIDKDAENLARLYFSGEGAGGFPATPESRHATLHRLSVGCCADRILKQMST